MTKTKGPARERGTWPVGTRFSFFVGGVAPVAKGSMRAFIPKGWDRAVITDSAGANLRAYENVVRNAARCEMDRRSLPCAQQQPFELLLAFYQARPAKDFGKGGLLPGSRCTPWVKPDLDKLERATLDAMTALVYDDDSRIVRVVKEKRFADAEHDVGVWIEARVLPATVRELREARQRELAVAPRSTT